MIVIQFIERNGRREYAIVPMPLFSRMTALLEDLDDEALYDKAKAGISKAYLCQIETGKRQGAIKTLKALAQALGVTLDDLQD